MRMRRRNTLQATLIVTAGTLVMGALISPAHAVIRNWDPAAGSFDWDSAGNWNPTGVPTTNDDVFINTTGGLVLLTDSSPFINFLDLTNTTLLTNGFGLRVLGTPGTMTVRGGATSGTGSVVVFPLEVSGTGGLVGDDLRIANRGLVTLQNDGSRARFFGQMTIDSGGEFRTSGAGTHMLDFATGTMPAMNNNGTITAGGGTTTIDLASTASIDLDGEFETGVVNVSAGATLSIVSVQSSPQSDPFDGTMNIGTGGATAVLDYPIWTIGAGGVVSLDNGEIQSDNFQNNGEIRGHGTVAVTDFTNNGALSGDGGTLVVAPTGNFNFTANPGAGVLNAVTGDLEIITGIGLPAYDGVINVGPGHELRPDGMVELEAGGSVNLTGGAILAILIADPLTTIHVMPGPESRIEALPGQSHQLNGLVMLDGDLRLVGNTSMDSTASFLGNGTLVVDAATTLRTTGSLTLGGGLRNEGTLRPGSSAGQITAGLDFEQTGAAMLAIELGGVTPGTGYDVLGAGGQATIAGTLDVTLINGFQPLPGDLFTVLTADGGVSGTFNTVNLPTLPVGLSFDLIYNPRNVTLQVSGTLLPGDLDGDGFVGITDLNIVLGNWNQNVPPANPLADPSGDGFVGIEDLNTVLGNWNAGTPPLADALANVPESGAVFVLGIVVLACRRHVQRGKE